MDHRNIIKIYRQNKTLSLASAGEKIWASRVYFASEGLYLYAIIEESNSYQNIKENNEVFFLIDRGKPDFFLQGRAKAEILGRPDKNPRQCAFLFQKNPEIIPFVKKHDNLVVVRIKPSMLYVSDFRTVYIPRTAVPVSARDLKQSLALEKKPPRALTLFKATRPFAFTASFISVALGTVLAPRIDPLLFLLTAAGIICIHAGVNALNDLMDYKYGYDTWLVLGASRVLQDKQLTVRAQAILVICLLAAGTVMGTVLTLLKGIELMLIGLTGVFVGIFYQIKPVGLKYRALGDLSVFIAFGPLLSLGAYFVQTGTVSFLPAAAAVPVGLIVIAIVHANNFRDLMEDEVSGYKTLAALLGAKGSSIYYTLLLICAYLLPIPLAAAGVLPPLSLLCWLSLPLAVKNMALSFRPDYLTFGLLDLLTARLHLLYGILMTGGILAGTLML
jgi:1,4-dihydroxy-2-naphthoate octaprenyltransferase